MKKAMLIACILTLILISLPVASNASDESSEELKLYVGEVKILPTNNPSRIVIGNPSIVDVTEVSKTEIAVSPKRTGTTSLVFWDNFGEQAYKIKVILANLGDIKSRIDYLLSKLNLPNVYTQIAEDEGKVLLLGRVKLAADREKINIALGVLREQTLDLIELKEEESVVEIDVQVLELDKDATSTLGFTSPTSVSLIEMGSPGISGAGTKFSTLFKVLNLQRGTTAGANPFIFKLDALVQQGKARVLSRPRLACQSGKEAELLVGGEKPIFTTNIASGGGTGTQVEYKEFGIKLKIKPTVTEEKRIKLALSVEVSEVGTAEFIGLTSERTAQAYPLSKRNASTELSLENGQTLAIGGLMKQRREEDITKTAFLGDIPILGALFRKKVSKVGGGTGERGDVELFITLTPNIVSDAKGVVEQKQENPPITESPVAATNITATNNLPESLAGYARAIQKRIVDNLAYPSQAKEAGFQGTVKLSLHLSYAGELLEASIKESSGYKMLDDQAMNVAKGIGSYPPFPASVHENDLWIDVPIAYQLN